MTKWEKRAIKGLPRIGESVIQNNPFYEKLKPFYTELKRKESINGKNNFKFKTNTKGTTKKNNNNKKVQPVKLIETNIDLSHLFKKPYSEFLKSGYWIRVKNLVLKRDNYTCTCGSKEHLHVHHKTYRHHFKELEYLEDLITLCEDCHKLEHKDKITSL